MCLKENSRTGELWAGSGIEGGGGRMGASLALAEETARTERSRDAVTRLADVQSLFRRISGLFYKRNRRIYGRAESVM